MTPRAKTRRPPRTNAASPSLAQATTSREQFVAETRAQYALLTKPLIDARTPKTGGREFVANYTRMVDTVVGLLFQRAAEENGRRAGRHRHRRDRDGRLWTRRVGAVLRRRHPDRVREEDQAGRSDRGFVHPPDVGLRFRAGSRGGVVGRSRHGTHARHGHQDGADREPLGVRIEARRAGAREEDRPHSQAATAKNSCAARSTTRWRATRNSAAASS